jgi:DNA replication protein DnaC
MANPLPQKRELGPVDFARINLHKTLWEADLAGVTAEVRAPVARFASRIVEARRHGGGAYFYGPIGSGKSGAAGVLAKEARAWGFTVYCTTVSELRDAVRDRKMFDAEASVLVRCRQVDALVLDDLQMSDKDEKFSVCRTLGT